MTFQESETSGQSLRVRGGSRPPRNGESGGHSDKCRWESGCGGRVTAEARHGTDAQWEPTCGASDQGSTGMVVT